MKISYDSSTLPFKTDRNHVVQDNILGIHDPVGHTNGDIRQRTKEGNDIALGLKNLTERRDNVVFVDLNIDDDDDDETTITSNATSPTPTLMSTNDNTTATANSVTPATKTVKKRRGKSLTWKL